MIRTGIKIHDIVFIDIETVSEFPDLEDYPEAMREIWEARDEDFGEKSGLYPEFSRIAIISIGVLKTDGTFALNSYADPSEEQLLIRFFQDLTLMLPKRKYLCGHNVKEFDGPFILKRAALHGVPVPEHISMYGKKPWELLFVDTMEIWAMGVYKSKYISLRLLCVFFGLPDPKNSMSGKDVDKVYRGGDWKPLIKYCEEDTAAVAMLYVAMTGDKKIEKFDFTNLETL